MEHSKILCPWIAPLVNVSKRAADVRRDQSKNCHSVENLFNIYALYSNIHAPSMYFKLELNLVSEVEAAFENPPMV
jgi:hypothetical protein